MKMLLSFFTATLIIANISNASSRVDELHREFESSKKPIKQQLLSSEWTCDQNTVMGEVVSREKFSFVESKGQILNKNSGLGKVFTDEADGYISLDLIEQKQRLLLFRINSKQELMGEYSVPKELISKKSLFSSRISNAFDVISYLKCKRSTNAVR